MCLYCKVLSRAAKNRKALYKSIYSNHTAFLQVSPSLWTAVSHHGRLYLPASWGRTETELRREACPPATAPSPLSTRRGSMETRGTHTHTHIFTTTDLKGYRHHPGPWTFLGGGAVSCGAWQVGNPIAACLHTCPVSSSTFSITYYDNYKDYSAGSAGCVMWTPHSCSNPQRGNKRIFEFWIWKIIVWNLDNSSGNLSSVKWKKIPNEQKFKVTSPWTET